MIKKSNILILLVFMASMVITSCVEEYDLEDKEFKSRLVVNSFFENDSPWSVDVSSSSDVFNENSKIEQISFAVVKIYDKNNKYIYDLYHQGDGIYSNGDFSPSSNSSYSIKVSAPGFEAVTAKSFAPEKSSLEIDKPSIVKNEKTNDIEEVDFEIIDKSNLESYYVWEIVKLEDDNGSNTNIASQLSETWINELANPVELANSNREILEGGSFGDGTYQGTYSSFNGNRRIGFIKNIKEDKTIKNIANSNFASSDSQTENGITYADIDPSSGNPNEIETYIDPKEGNPDVGGDGESKDEFEYELRVMSISKELYEYHNSIRDNNSISHSNQPPPKIYSNVTNGLGIFAGFSESIIQF